MYYKGSIHKPIGKKGYLCGAFLVKGHPLYSEKMEVAYMHYDKLKKHEGGKHHHNKMDEFVIVIKGYMEQEVDNVLLKLEEGDFFFVKAGATTETKRVDEGTDIVVIKSPSLPRDKIKDS